MTPKGIKKKALGKKERRRSENSPSRTERSFPSFSVVGWDRCLLLLFLLGGLLAVAKHQGQLGLFLLVAGGIFGASFWLPVLQKGQVWAILGTGWVLCLLALGGIPHFQYAFIPLGGLSLPNPIFHFAVGFGLLLAAWRRLPHVFPLEDLNPAIGRFWFWAILAGAVFLRFQKIGEAPGPYWDDPAVCIIDPQGVLNFYEHPMLFPLGQREPFFSYFMAGLWSLMPHAPAILVQRLGGAALDLAAVVVFYFLGKETGGLQVGLVAEAIAAFSKPLLIENLIGMTAVTVPLAVGLLLWTTVRLFKKDSWPRFMWWGGALGFGPYNYTPVRTWLPFLVTVVFLWIWFFKLKGRPKSWGEYVLGWGTMLMWNVLFLKVNNFLPSKVLSFGVSGKVWLVSCFLAVFLFCCLRLMAKKTGPAPMLPAFFGGVLLAAVLVYPLASNPEIAEHTSGLSIFHNQETRTFDYQSSVFGTMVRQTLSSLRTMFIGGQDRGDLNLPWDAFFEFHFVPIFLIGFVAFLSRPSWWGFFFFLGGWVGISTHILSIDPHSAKLVAAVAPLAVFSGLGVRRLFSTYYNQWPGRGRWMAFFCLCYLGWAFWGTYDRVWVKYFNMDGVDKIVSREVGVLAGHDRVYLAPYADFASPETQTLLDEGHRVFMLRDQNPIFLRPGENVENVAVLLSPGDLKQKALIQKQFPGSEWDTVQSQREGQPKVLTICRIPSQEIPDHPGELFQVRKVPESYWVRDFYVGRYLLRSGLVAEEDCVPSPDAPVPNDMGQDVVRIMGTLDVPRKGNLGLSVKSDNYALLDMDGKNVLDFRPWNVEKTASCSFPVSAGVHKVSYLAYLHVGNQIPEIKIGLDGGLPVPLGHSALISQPAPDSGASAFHFGASSN